MVSVLSGTAPSGLSVDVSLPETSGYRLKRKLLGPALTNDQLEHERLSKRLALGVLSSDCISSSAYGTEEILIVLLPTFGLAAYALLLPMTLVVLAVLVLVTLSYRQVVMVYTKAGGSYVVARENFGPAVAQVAAVALMLDYIVTVAVQAAAGTVAVASRPFPTLGGLASGDHRRRRAAALLRQPARAPRGRPDLRLPDLLLRRLDGPGDRRRGIVREVTATCRTSRPTSGGLRWDTGTASFPRWRSSCCCARSPTAARR